MQKKFLCDHSLVAVHYAHCCYAFFWRVLQSLLIDMKKLSAVTPPPRTKKSLPLGAPLPFFLDRLPFTVSDDSLYLQFQNLHCLSICTHPYLKPYHPGFLFCTPYVGFFPCKYLIFCLQLYYSRVNNFHTGFRKLVKNGMNCLQFVPCCSYVILPCFSII